MKFLYSLLLFSLVACSVPLKPQPTGTKEIEGEQGRAKYWITRVFEAPVCTLWYFPGVDETENPVRSGKYPHSELVPMAKKLGCNIASMSYGATWMLDGEFKYGIPACWFNCKKPPSMDEFLADMKEIEIKYSMPNRRYAEGVSQGGFNLSRIAMKYPELFVKVIVAHPVMKHRDYNFLMETMLISKNYSDFSKVNPVELIKTAAKISPTHVFSCNADILVPADAAQEFARICKARKLDCVLHIDSKGCEHGKFDSTVAFNWITK